LHSRVQSIVRFHIQTPLCTAKLTVEGCQSAEGNAETDGAETPPLERKPRV